MELSVIIVSFNVSDFLKECLFSARKSSENINCEIFVVDNNSQDDSCDMVVREFPEVRLIKNKVNFGFSAANNQAIKLAAGRFVLLLNPDTIVNIETFSRCITFMDNNCKVGALGVRMVNGEGIFLPESKRALPTIETAFFKSFGFSFLFPKSKKINRYYLPHIGSYETSSIEVVSGAFMFIRREALDKTGLLDENFFMYGEDIDMSYRLLRNGYLNYYFADTQIVHFKGRSTSNKKYTDIFHFFNAMRVYVRKRVAEGNFDKWRFIIIPAIYFREGLAIINRFFRIAFR
jgi:GT2 family glycosyltransferase